MNPWLQQSAVTLGAGGEIQDMLVILHSWCICCGLEAGDLHQVSTVIVLLVGLHFLSGSGPPATMGVTEHPQLSVEGIIGGSIPWGASAPSLLPRTPAA